MVLRPGGKEGSPSGGADASANIKASLGVAASVQTSEEEQALLVVVVVVVEEEGSARFSAAVAGELVVEAPENCHIGWAGLDGLNKTVDHQHRIHQRLVLLLALLSAISLQAPQKHRRSTWARIGQRGRHELVAYAARPARPKGTIDKVWEVFSRRVQVRRALISPNGFLGLFWSQFDGR